MSQLVPQKQASRAEQTGLFRNLEERKTLLPVWNLNTPSPLSFFPLSCSSQSYLYMLTYCFQKLFGNFFSISYSWVWSWANGTGWESSYWMNGLHPFKTVKDTKDRKEREALPKPENTDTLETGHLNVSRVLDRILDQKGKRRSSWASLQFGWSLWIG